MEDGVIFIDLEVFPLKVNWVVPSLAPPFSFTTREFTTCLALLKYISDIESLLSYLLNIKIIFMFNRSRSNLDAVIRIQIFYDTRIATKLSCICPTLLLSKYTLKLLDGCDNIDTPITTASLAALFAFWTITK